MRRASPSTSRIGWAHSSPPRRCCWPRIWVLRERTLARAHLAAIAVLVALALQLTIGISMVVQGFPLWLATAHNGGAALLLLATLALNHRLIVSGARS